MGSDPAAAYAPDADEAPRRRVPCPAFGIGRTPVTNAQYRDFVDGFGPSCAFALAGRRDPVRPGAAPGHLRLLRRRARVLPLGRRPAAERGRVGACGARRRRPHVAVGRRATHGRAGDVRHDGYSPVGLHPFGASPFGAFDLAGNAWEWTASALRPYPYDGDDGREAVSSPEPRVVRGGAYIHGPGEIRCSYRHGTAAGRGRPLRWLPPRLRSRGAPAARAGRGRRAGRGGRARQRSTTIVRAGAPRRGSASHGHAARRAAWRDAGYERAVPGVRPRDGPPGSAALARRTDASGARAASGHVRRLVRRERLLPLRRRAAADRGGVGEGRARRRRPPLSLGLERARRRAAQLRGRVEARGDEPCRRVPRRCRPQRPARHGGERLGVGEQRLRAVPVRRRRRARGPGVRRARASCAAAPTRARARGTSAAPRGAGATRGAARRTSAFAPRRVPPDRLARYHFDGRI